MKVAIVSESPADEAALTILINSLTGRTNEIICSGRMRPGGWTAAIKALEVELKHLHYNTDGHAIIAVVDSDDSPIHDESHESPDGAVDECRVCAILARIRSIQRTLKPRYVNYAVEIAIGLAVPALEAWLLYGTNPHVVEARFERDRADHVDLQGARRRLKRDLYGTERPSLHLEKEIAIREATRIAANLPALETAFPNFRRFAQQIRCW